MIPTLVYYQYLYQLLLSRISWEMYTLAKWNCPHKHRPSLPFERVDLHLLFLYDGLLCSHTTTKEPVWKGVSASLISLSPCNFIFSLAGQLHAHCFMLVLAFRVSLLIRLTATYIATDITPLILLILPLTLLLPFCISWSCFWFPPYSSLQSSSFPHVKTCSPSYLWLWGTKRYL